MIDISGRDGKFKDISADKFYGNLIGNDASMNDISAINVYGKFYGNVEGVNIGTITDLSFSIKTNDVDRLVIDQSGSVGIGTAQPKYDMHIYKADNNAGLMIQTAGESTSTAQTVGDKASLYLSDRPLVNDEIYSGFELAYEKQKVSFNTYDLSNAPVTDMTIKQIGSNTYVGIGEANPVYTLHVDGNIKLTGSIIDADGSEISALEGTFTATDKGITIETFTGSATQNRLYNENGVLKFNGGSIGPTNLNFPINDGSQNYVLQTDGNGNLEWVENRNIYIERNPVNNGLYIQNSVNVFNTVNQYVDEDLIMTFSPTGKSFVGSILACATLNKIRYIYVVFPTHNNTTYSKERQVWRFDYDGNAVHVAGGKEPSSMPGAQVAGKAGQARFLNPHKIVYDEYRKKFYICDGYKGDGTTSVEVNSGYMFNFKLVELDPLTTKTRILTTLDISGDYITGFQMGTDNNLYYSGPDDLYRYVFSIGLTQHLGYNAEAYHGGFVITDLSNHLFNVPLMTHNTSRRTRINTVDIVNGTKIDLRLTQDVPKPYSVSLLDSSGNVSDKQRSDIHELGDIHSYSDTYVTSYGTDISDGPFAIAIDISNVADISQVRIDAIKINYAPIRFKSWIF